MIYKVGELKVNAKNLILTWVPDFMDLSKCNDADNWHEGDVINAGEIFVIMSRVYHDYTNPTTRNFIEIMTTRGNLGFIDERRINILD